MQLKSYNQFLVFVSLAFNHKDLKTNSYGLNVYDKVTDIILSYNLILIIFL